MGEKRQYSSSTQSLWSGCVFLFRRIYVEEALATVAFHALRESRGLIPYTDYVGYVMYAGSEEFPAPI
jgi:hypothetical protein